MKIVTPESKDIPRLLILVRSAAAVTEVPVYGNLGKFETIQVVSTNEKISRGRPSELGEISNGIHTIQSSASLLTFRRMQCLKVIESFFLSFLFFYKGNVLLNRSGKKPLCSPLRKERSTLLLYSQYSLDK